MTDELMLEGIRYNLQNCTPTTHDMVWMLDKLREVRAENERLRKAITGAMAEYDRMVRFSCTQEQSWPEYQMYQILKAAIEEGGE